MNFGQSNSGSSSSDEALRAIPKVELHRHLECSMRLSTLIELAHQQGLSVPASREEIKDQFLVTSPMSDLPSVLSKFLRTQRILSSEEILTRLTFEAIEDAAAEGVRILELRWAPTYIAQGHPQLSFEKILAAIQKGAEMAQHLPIAVGFISILQRILPLKEAEAVVDFTIAHKDSFVGVDLADNEEGFEPQKFRPLFERYQKAGLNITIHAGESAFAGSALNVQNSIEQLGAKRIGHGVQIAHSPEVIDLVRRRAIPLELCLTSNWLTQAVPRLQDHPIRQLLQAGVPVTINTDDPGIFDTNLIHEYRLLVRDHGFTEADFDHCNDVAAQASFIPLLKKQKFWPRPIHSLR